MDSERSKIDSSLESNGANPTSGLNSSTTDSNDKSVSVDSFEQILIQLWKGRAIESEANITDFVALVSGLIANLDIYLSQIEFFLPQLANLIIYLGKEWKISNGNDGKMSNAIIKSLDSLTAKICHRSATLALDLKLIVISAMEDYQPELGGGLKNPSYSSKYLSRCAQLIALIDRIVVFGTSINHVGDSQQNRGCNITDIVDASANYNSTIVSGELYYKRVHRKNIFRTKPWKKRFFEIKDRTLYCYYSSDSYMNNSGYDARKLLRVISLQTCTLSLINFRRYSHSSANALDSDAPKSTYSDTPGNSYEFHFEVSNLVNNTKFQLRAKSLEDFNKWYPAIEREIGNGVVPLDFSNFLTHYNSLHANVNGSASEISETQTKLYFIFRNQQIFLQRMVDIAERMRLVERIMRKTVLRSFTKDLEVPFLSYLPTSQNWSNKFQCVLRSIPDESHPFNTKARCPCLFLFEVENHPESFSESLFDKNSFSIEQVKSSITCKSSTNIKSITSRFSSLSTPQKEVVSVSDIMVDAVASPAVAKPLLSHELFAEKILRLKAVSDIQSSIPTWNINGLIAKSNDDVRQEVFIMQMIAYFKKTFIEYSSSAKDCSAWLYTYKILGASKTAGLIELIPDAISLDALKKQADWPGSLKAYFDLIYGHDAAAKHNAISNFANSLAGYSIISYLLAIKDRHNGNIMMDCKGHLIHIDFGFVLGLAPGKQFSMERAAFKLTQEYVDLLGGLESEYFKLFRRASTQALIAARAKVDNLCLLMEITSLQSNYPALLFNTRAIPQFRSRFRLDVPDSEIGTFVDSLISDSFGHAGTALYDKFQTLTNGYAA